MRRRRLVPVAWACGLAAAFLWVGYALPLFFPPPSTDCGAGVPANASLMTRLFPDVPAWWVRGRLACLLVAALLVAVVARRAMPEASPDEPRNAPRPGRGVVWAALAAASLQTAAAFWASRFGRAEQLLYVAALGLPALLLLVGSPRTGSVIDRRLLASLGLISSAWVVLRLPIALHSPRAASAVDTLGALTYLEETTLPGFNLLTPGLFKGVSSLFFVFQGAGLFGSGGLPLTLPVLQGVNVAWMAIIAVGVGLLAARLVAPVSAPIASAFFLFSPFALLAPLGPIALFHGALLTTGLLLLFLAVHRRRSPPAIAAFGALAGIGASHPVTAPIAVAMCAAAIWSACRPPRVPPILALVALLSFTAAVLPGLPSAEDLRSMRDSYTLGQKAWRPLQHILLGQGSPTEKSALASAGHSGPLDVPFGALLTPFAVPRTPERLWGDALYEPIGTGLAAYGVAVCLFAVRRSAVARGLLALLAVGLIPGFVSGADRPSLTRTCVAHTVLALLAALGFEVIRRRFVPTWRPVALVAAGTIGIAGGGMLLFDVVNPRILPASAMAIALEALGPRPPADVVVLDHAEVEYGWLRIAQAAAAIPARPIRTVSYGGADDLAEAVGSGAARLIFWTPGLEAQHGVAAAMCARWPTARLYTLEDRTGCAHVLAARIGGDAWRPALAADRWTERGCGAAGAARPMP